MKDNKRIQQNYKGLSNFQQDINILPLQQLTYPSRENLENCTVYLGTTLRGRLGERSLRGDRSLERFRVGERSLDLLRSLSLSRLHKHRQHKAWACTPNKDSQYAIFSDQTTEAILLDCMHAHWPAVILPHDEFWSVTAAGEAGWGVHTPHLLLLRHHPHWGLQQAPWEHRVCTWQRERWEIRSDSVKVWLWKVEGFDEPLEGGWGSRGWGGFCSSGAREAAESWACRRDGGGPWAGMLNVVGGGRDCSMLGPGFIMFGPGIWLWKNKRDGFARIYKWQFYCAKLQHNFD